MDRRRNFSRTPSERLTNTWSAKREPIYQHCSGQVARSHRNPPEFNYSESEPSTSTLSTHDASDILWGNDTQNKKADADTDRWSTGAPSTYTYWGGAGKPNDSDNPNQSTGSVNNLPSHKSVANDSSRRQNTRKFNDRETKHRSVDPQDSQRFGGGSRKRKAENNDYDLAMQTASKYKADSFQRAERIEGKIADRKDFHSDEMTEIMRLEHSTRLDEISLFKASPAYKNYDKKFPRDTNSGQRPTTPDHPLIPTQEWRNQLTQWSTEVNTLQNRNELPVKKGIENDEEVLIRRQKNIDYMKTQENYEKYLIVVPKHKRKKTDPRTPDKYAKASRRQWDGMIKAWKREIHKSVQVVAGVSLHPTNEAPP